MALIGINVAVGYEIVWSYGMGFAVYMCVCV